MIEEGAPTATLASALARAVAYAAQAFAALNAPVFQSL
jgi:hypothetical protein